MPFRYLAIVTSATASAPQAALACGLLQLAPLKPRTVGLLGVVASAMNCYFLLPAYPKLIAAAPKPKEA